MHINIPAGLTFADLRLARTGSGDVSFDTSVIAQIEQASGLTDGHSMALHEDVLGELLTTWYTAHIRAGGAPDPIAEDLLAEMRAEDEHGGGLSHPPGRA